METEIEQRYILKNMYRNRGITGVYLKKNVWKQRQNRGIFLKKTYMKKGHETSNNRKKDI